MDDKGIGLDLVISIIGNITWSALAFAGVIIYKRFKNQTPEIRNLVIGTLIGLTLSTFTCLVVFFFAHDPTKPLLLQLISTTIWAFVVLFPVMLVANFFSRELFGEKGDAVGLSLFFLHVMIGLTFMILGIISDFADK
jgi:cobalamin synthase